MTSTMVLNCIEIILIDRSLILYYSKVPLRPIHLTLTSSMILNGIEWFPMVLNGIPLGDFYNILYY